MLGTPAPCIEGNKELRMSSIHSRLTKLERCSVLLPPPVHCGQIHPEIRALFEELSPLLEKSQAYGKVLEDAKLTGITEESRRAFWITLRELLLPHPALFYRLSDLLCSQVEASVANRAAGENSNAHFAEPI
jgi:hypothetical protein